VNQWTPKLCKASLQTYKSNNKGT